MKPTKFLLALLPYLYPGTSDEFWFRRVRDGRLVVEPGKASGRYVLVSEIEQRFGPISEQRITDATQAYKAKRQKVCAS